MMKYKISLILILTAVQYGHTLPTGQGATAGVSVANDQDPDDDASAANDSTTAEETSLEEYFIQYSSSYVKEDIGAAKSSSGPGADDDSNKPTAPLSESPPYVESVINLQQLSGQTPTGTVTKETIEVASQDRCGVPDPVIDPNAPGEYKVNTIWKSKYNADTQLYYVTYSIFKQGFPKNARFSEFEQGLISGMCSWELVSNIRFKNLGMKKTKADVQLKFEEGDHGDGYAFDGKGKTLAHAFYPDDGRLHLDAAEAWYAAKAGKVDYMKKDFYTVALHELGHTIGLLHSDAKNSIMAPFYQYLGLFNTFELPEDDWNGVANMYGARKNSDPASEEISACRQLKDRFGVTVPAKVMKEEKKTTAVFEEFLEVDASCNDEELYISFCPGWKAQGYCIRDNFVNVMSRRCKRTCDFCAGPIPARKTAPEKVSSLKANICNLAEFDSVSTVVDVSDTFFAYVFKDDYYFKNRAIFSAVNGSRPSFLNDSSLNGTYKFEYDPKAFTQGILKFQTPEFLGMSEKVDAMIVIGTRYIAFDGKRVHIYSKTTPLTLFEKTFPLKDLFPGYPHLKVDTAHVEFNQPWERPTYTLFYGSKIWQFQEAFDTDEQGEKAESRRQVRPFIPITDRLEIDIVEWHGVPACDVDSVFSYQGIPYFLKDNTFWPAVDTEPQVPRDITYYFFRCWQEEPKVTSIPSSCDPGNGADSSSIAKGLTFISILVSYFLIFLSSSA